jgi:flagellar basal body rod protein FlgG
MTSTAAIALSGMNAAGVSLQASAHNIANLATPGFRRAVSVQASSAFGGVSASLAQASGPGDSPETDMVGLLQAKNAFLSNLAVFRTGDRMMGSLLDATG